MPKPSSNLSEDGLGVVDLQAFVETLKRRWWIVPAVLATTVVLLWAQESNLATTPASYTLSRSYEGNDIAGVLNAVGIDPASVRPFPDVDNQINILQSAATRRAVENVTGLSVPVNVTRTKPSFSLVSSQQADGQSSFVFSSAGVPTYNFSCSETIKADCAAVIDEYARQASELRRTSIKSGIQRLLVVLRDVHTKTSDPSLGTKVVALESLVEDLRTPLLLVSENELAVGPTVTTVRRFTFGFGIVAGAVLSLLILIQLTFSDGRLRTPRHAARLAGSSRYLGLVSRNEDDVAVRRTAISIRRELLRADCDSVKFIPLTQSLEERGALERVAALGRFPVTLSEPFSQLNVAEWMNPTSRELTVLVAQANFDKKREVADLCECLPDSGQPFGGLVLLV